MKVNSGGVLVGRPVGELVATNFARNGTPVCQKLHCQKWAEADPETTLLKIDFFVTKIYFFYYKNTLIPF